MSRECCGFPSNLPVGRKRLSRANFGCPSVHPVGRKRFSRANFGPCKSSNRTRIGLAIALVQKYACFVRAHRSHRWGRWFEPNCHHISPRGSVQGTLGLFLLSAETALLTKSGSFSTHLQHAIPPILCDARVWRSFFVQQFCNNQPFRRSMTSSCFMTLWCLVLA